jgi:hypothetical protein
MANALNDKARITAEKLLSKFGAVATLTKVTTGVYNPDTQSVTNTTVVYNIHTYADKPSVGIIQSGMATVSDMMFTVSALELGVTPMPNDTLTFGSQTFSVIRDVPIYGGSDIAIHQLICMAR